MRQQHIKLFKEGGHHMTMQRKSWKELEKYQLWLGYNVKVPMKVLGDFFDRTDLAVSKGLERSGIRKVGSTPRGVRPGSSKVDYITKTTFHDILKAHGLLSLSVGRKKDEALYIQNSRLQFNEDYKDIWKKSQISFKAPWTFTGNIMQQIPKNYSGKDIMMARVDSAVANLPLNSGSRVKQNKEWRTFGELMGALQQMGVDVKEVRRSKIRENSLFRVGNRPMTSQQLLLHLNESRINCGMKPLKVHGVTQ